MRLGIALLPAPPWDEVVSQVLTVEQGGFDILMTGDHMRHPTDPEVEFLDGWSVLAAWAALTSRVRLAMLVSNVIYRNPALLARQAAAVDQISRGRLDLGIGSGVFGTDHAMAGVERWSLDERLERTEEVVEIVDRLLRGVVDDYEGRWYRVREAAMSPGPVQQPRPPIVVGANHRRMLRLAARRADTWNTWGGYGLDAEEFFSLTAQRVDVINRLCGEFGRDQATLRRSVLVHHSAFDPWRSAKAFECIVERFRHMGFSECIFYWPDPHERPIFDDIVARVLPTLSEVT